MNKNPISLQVVCRWRGVVLETRHFSGEAEVLVGPRRNFAFAFPIPFAGKDRLQLAKREGDQYAVMLKPESSNEQKLLHHEDEATVKLGEFEFRCSYVPTPPEIAKKRMPPEPLFFRLSGISIAFTTALLMTLSQLEIPETVDVETIPDRVATILYQPEKFDRFEQPRDPEVAKAPEATPPKAEPKHTKIDIVPGQKPVKKEEKTSATPKVQAQSSGKEGAGARARGQEGTRGTRGATPSANPQNVARRPSPERGKGAGGGRSQVAEDGSLDALRGAGERIKDLLSGATARLGKSGEKLKGFGAFETEGSSGLALSQQGRGGGGRSQGLGGLAQSGTGGGRVGVGAGSSGTGSGILSGRGRVDLRQGGPEETVVMGSIDAAAIEAAILAHKDEFRLCYERELNAERPQLSGRVLPLFVIGSAGKVTRAAVKESSLHNANVERCVLQVIKRIQFPLPAGGGTVEVTYPFKFRALGG